MPAHLSTHLPPWPPLVPRLAAVLASEGMDLRGVWIVGGAVRDLVLGRAVHDLDLATASGGLEIARLLADRLDGAFFPLDAGRGCGRAVLRPSAGNRFEVDVADLRAPTLLADLAERDYALNAMAASLAAPDVLIDPLGGRADLDRRQVRAPTATVLSADGLRGLRGVRLAAQLGFAIEPATRSWIRAAAPALATVAAERIGAELWKCFAAERSAGALAEMLALDLLRRIVPEATATVGLPANPLQDVWEHTLDVVGSAERLRALLAGAAPVDPFETALGAALAPFADRLAARLAIPLAVGRPAGPTFELAAFLHDLAKSTTARHDVDKVRFPGHEDAGAGLAEQRLLALRFSREEAAWVASLVRHHRLPRLLDGAAPLDRRAIHRFHRTAGPVGVEVCLLSLADNLVKHQRRSDLAGWQQLLARVGELVAGALDHHHTLVAPPPLLAGRDLLALGMAPGPAVGVLLAALVEAQAVGEVQTRDEASAFALARITSGSASRIG